MPSATGRPAPHRSFRPHRRFLGVGLVAAVLAVAPAAILSGQIRRAESELATLRDDVVAAERAVDDLALALDEALSVKVRLVAGMSVAEADLQADYDAWARASSRLDRSRQRAQLAAAGLVPPDRLEVLDTALDDYHAFIGETFPVDALQSIGTDEIARRVRAAAGPFESARTATLDVRDELRATADGRAGQLADVLHATRVALLGAGTLSAVVVVALATSAAARMCRVERGVAEEERVRRRQARHADFEARLLRGLEMALDDGEILTLVVPALAEVTPGRSAHVLVADSDRAPFSRTAATTDADGCTVRSPADCPAVARGHTLAFPSSAALDGCPYLRAHPAGSCSALCVPVGGGGHGVIHVVGPDGAPPGAETVVDIEVVARRTSERLTLVRAWEQTGTEVATDPATGLLTRRSLESRVRALRERTAPFVLVVVVVDIPATEAAADSRDDGDARLRHVAEVLRDSVRPTDIPARLDERTFAVVLPECDTADAHHAVSRVRARLAATDGTGPPAAVHVGLATHQDGGPLDEVVAAARAAAAPGTPRSRAPAGHDTTT